MGFFTLPTNPTFYEMYLGGFPDLRYKTSATIVVMPDKLTFKLLKGFKNVIYEVPLTDILELGFNSETYRSAGKTAAGAVIGGVLTGGIGLLAGAALGGRRHKNDKLTLMVKYNNGNHYIELQPSKTIEKLYKAIKTALPVKENEQSHADSSTEIEHFYELMQKGIITKDEFDQKKKQLLGL